jgi:apolipoprotein D and lipocalin family protein
MSMLNIRATLLAVTITLTLAACSTAPPDGVLPVQGFDIQRYLGKWHEIARLDHSFERGLSDVSATYTRQDDGSIKVVNRGFDIRRGTWKEAVGHALFIGNQQTASLKVSFFGPFYGGYHLIALDHEHYRWSLVAGPSRDYLWILAREKTLPEVIREQLVGEAKRLGFATEQLIWVEHTRGDAAP